MTQITGKTGADGISRAMKRICLILKKYDAKLRALVDALVASNVISAADKAVIITFLDSTDALCRLFDLIANYSNVF